MKVRTVKGKEIDMSALIAKNQHVPAVGNAGMNARGDLIDRGGKVVKKREELSMEYHQNVARAVKTVGVKSLTGEIFATPAEALAAAKKTQMEQQAAKNAAQSQAHANLPSPPPHVHSSATSGSGSHAEPHRKRKLIEDPDANL